MRRILGPALLVLLAGCGTDTEPDPIPDPEEEIVYLSPTEHLVRASMALRGMRPSIEELQRVEEDPAALDEIVSEYVDSKAFGRTIRELHNETFLSSIDWAYYPAGFQPVDELVGQDIAEINKSVMQAPLRLVESVVMEDRPYTEIVTADHTMASSISSTVWGLAYDPNGPEWQVSRYEDGRGNAGVLTDSWLYVRYQSTPSNANRQRANAVSRALLCYDFLSRDVVLDTAVDVADPNAVQAAVVANEACASCHQALDPLASFFKDMFPILVPQTATEYPIEGMYFPGVFETYLEIDMREPAFFGQPGETLQDLGKMIAEDPRFSLCAAQRFYSYFNQVHLDDVPLESAAELQDVLVSSGMNAKELAKAIVLSDDFRVSHAESEDVGADLPSMRKARPDEVATMFEDLTGFVWMTDLALYTEGTIGEVELPRDSMLGYRVIGGGIDGAYVTANTFTDNAGTSLFLRGFAQEAAAYVVAKDFDIADPAERTLLRRVKDASDVDAARAQIADLHARLFGELVDADGPEVDASYALFSDVLEASDDPKRAWTALLVAMMQDVRVSYY